MLVPWNQFLENPEEMNKFLEGVGKKSFSRLPAIDIYEKENSIVVEAPLPSINPENVEISIENDVLTMRGKMEKKSEVDEKNYYRKEVCSGSFFRQIPLPKPVIGEEATAAYEDGVLKVSVPVAGGREVKTIPIEITKKKK
jgi:HSP20 family protein